MAKYFSLVVLCSLVMWSGQIVFAQEVSTPEMTVVRITVAAHDQTLFDGEISVAACDSDGPGDGALATTGYCAVNQLGLAEAWSWWESDAFLDSLSGFTSDYGQNWYWSWFSNLTLGQTALNKHLLAQGEHLLITYNTYPLRLSADSLSPAVGTSVRFTGDRFGYDSAWNPVWLPAAGGSLTVGALSYGLSEAGLYDLSISSEASTTAYITLAGYVQSPSVTLVPVASAVPEPAPVVEPEVTTRTGGESSDESFQESEFDLNKAVSFITSFQKGDGSFGDDRYTDWAMIALAAARTKVSAAQEAFELGSEYLLRDQLSKNARLTDYERRALALMAARINPYDGTPVNYIEAILDGFDGEQFGDPDQENDDVFALLVLLKAGYGEDDEVIQALISHLLAKQEGSGEWFGIDLTAAALQALESLRGDNEVLQAITRGRDYLASQQRGDGSFGNPFSESWVMQALGSGDWLSDMSGVLAAAQEPDGGVLAQEESDENRLWSTAYAIPAHLRKSWPAIMKAFKKPVVEKEDDKEEERDEDVKEDAAPIADVQVPAPLVLGAFYEETAELPVPRGDSEEQPEGEEVSSLGYVAAIEDGAGERGQSFSRRLVLILASLAISGGLVLRWRIRA